MARTYRVAFGYIELAGIFSDGSENFREALLESWEPGTSVTRYRRKWIISAPHEQDDGVLTGRIGFVREDEMSTLEFDEEIQDFRRGVASGGVVIPFAVNLAARRVAFQLVSGEVRTTSFTGAFESVLNTSDVYKWRVRPLVRQADFDTWRSEVDHITSFKFRLQRPNPHYSDDAMVEELMESLRTGTLNVAGSGEDVDEEADFFRQALDHTLRDYGRAVIRGERGGEESEWRSTEDGTVPAETRVESENEDELPEGELPPLLDDVGEALESDDVDEDDFSET